MSCLAWNCRRLGNLHTGGELIEIIRKKDPAVVFLVETLTDNARLEFVQRSISFDHRWVEPRVGRGGGLVLYWKASINLTVEGSNRYHIDAVIDKNTKNEWRLTGFYGEPDKVRRHEAWNKLKGLNNRRSLGFVTGILMKLSDKMRNLGVQEDLIIKCSSSAK